MSAISTPVASNLQQAVYSTKTINGTAAASPNIVPIFRITGNVQIVRLSGNVTTALANHTAASFRVNDQTVQTQVTSLAGSSCTNFVSGSYIYKGAAAGTAVSARNSNVAQIVDSGSFVGFFVQAKNGANTDIEYVYTTTDSPTSGVIEFRCDWTPLSSGALVVAI